jgi:hypothetical protein
MGLFILMSGLLASPLYFQQMWAKRWFRVVWGIGLLMMVSIILRSANIINGAP